MQCDDRNGFVSTPEKESDTKRLKKTSDPEESTLDKDEDEDGYGDENDESIEGNLNQKFTTFNHYKSVSEQVSLIYKDVSTEPFRSP